MPPHMLDYPLLLSTLYERAVRIYPHQEIVSANPDGSLHRTDYGTTDVRIRKLASAMASLGIEPGDPIGTLAFNTHRHHEIYWATANTGRICHTINIRLFAEQVRYIIEHAGDRVVFVERSQLPVVEALASDLPQVSNWILMDCEPSETSLPGSINYEDLIVDSTPVDAWPQLDERSPHMYCYTSGTTGNPKGVAYTQRSTYLHTLTAIAYKPVAPSDNVMPVVPMFHAAAWGLPFTGTAAGAKLTYPGQDLSAAALVDLIEDEGVTFSAGVPTVWLGIQNHLDVNPDRDTSSIHSFLCGGSAVPRAMIDWFWRNRGIRVVQAWGMTETNPLATMANLRPEMESWDWERQLDFLETAGLPAPGLKVKIVDDHGDELPHDGEAFGELLIQGPWIAAEYLRDPRSPETMVDGWLRTGDVCKITPEGYVRITDRSKDVIKSGGEWISSIDVENLIMGHPDVAEAAVVGVPHPKWQERPVALVVTRAGKRITGPELASHLEGKIARWWIPDEYLFVDDVPKTSTGKFDKKVIRDEYADLLQPQP